MLVVYSDQDQTVSLTVNYHQRIDIAELDIIHFCLATGDTTSNKQSSSSSGRFSQGWSPFSVFFASSNGSLFVIAPVIPDRQLLTEQTLQDMSADVSGGIDRKLFESWIETKFVRASADLYRFDARKQFFFSHRSAVTRQVHKLQLVGHEEKDDDDEDDQHVSKCKAVFVVDTSAFFFDNQEQQQQQQQFIPVPPILVRVWEDRRLDVIACLSPIKPQWTFDGYDDHLDGDGDEQDGGFDGLLVSQHYLKLQKSKKKKMKRQNQDQIDNNSQSFVLNCKMAQSMDSVIFADMDCDHGRGSMLTLCMDWLPRMPTALTAAAGGDGNGGSNHPFLALLRKSISTINELHFSTASQTTGVSMLSDFILLRASSGDSDCALVLRNAPTGSSRLDILTISSKDVDGSAIPTQMKLVAKKTDIITTTKFDAPERLLAVKKRVRNILSGNEFDQSSFSFSDERHLELFLRTVKTRLEEDVLSELALLHTLMDERQRAISAKQTAFVSVQMRVLQSKMADARRNQAAIEDKVRRVMRNHRRLEKRVTECMAINKSGWNRNRKNSDEQDDDEKHREEQLAVKSADEQYNHLLQEFNRLSSKTQQMIVQGRNGINSNEMVSTDNANSSDIQFLQPKIKASLIKQSELLRSMKQGVMKQQD